MNLFYVLNFLMGLFGVIALGLTYTYIDKLEKMGCACSAHKYRDFIKTWSLIALFYVLVMMFAPVKMVTQMSAQMGMLYTAFSALFFIVHVVYVVLTLVYINYLITEKCKCSEDVRRELLYVWFILRALVIFSLVLLTILVPLAMTSVGTINAEGKDIMSATVNPVNSAKKIPRTFKKSFRKFK